MVLKCHRQYNRKFGKLSSGHRTGKGQFSFQSQRRQCQRMLNYCTIAFISHASKVMLKILQARLQQHVNQEIPDVQAGFRKVTGTREQIASIFCIIQKAREFQKKTSASLTMLKPSTVCITTKYGKFFKRLEYQITLLASSETCIRVKKQQLEPDMGKWTGSKLGKEYI